MTDKSEKIDFNPPSSSIKKKNSIISNLKEGQVSNSIDVELITKIKQVKEENDRLNKELQNCIKIVEENKKLKERVKNQDKEIAILEEKINLYDSAQAKNEEELVEEIRTELEESFKEKITSLTNEVTKLNKELSDKNVKLSTLEVTLSESKSTIDNLTNLNKNLQEQVTKRSTSDLFEMDNLMEKISKLEGEKEEQNQRIKELTDQLQNYSTNYSSISSISSNEVNGVPEYKKALTHLKHELKVQIKKNEETKLELESQIKQKEIEIAKGEAKIKELENTIEIIVNENDDKAQVLQAIPISGDDDNHTANKQLINLADYDCFEAMGMCNKITRDENGNLLSFFDWEASGTLLGVGADYKNGDLQIVQAPIDKDKNDYYCIFHIYDVYGNVTVSELIPFSD